VRDEGERAEQAGEGRIAQFRINAITGTSPKTLKIGYTTWE